MLVVVLPLKSVCRGKNLQSGKGATKLFVPFDLVIPLLGINPWEIIQRKGGGGEQFDKDVRGSTVCKIGNLAGTQMLNAVASKQWSY